MDISKQAWFANFSLKQDQFASLPEGENPLIWALSQGIIPETNYSHWASHQYLLPLLDRQFFALSSDSLLPQKYQSIYNWNSQCFPVYEWENILYIACLEPLEIQSDKEICWVIAPWSAMHGFWEKHSCSQEQILTAPPLDPLLRANDNDTAEVSKAPEPLTQTPLPNLDFSDLNFSQEVTPLETCEADIEKNIETQEPVPSETPAIDFSQVQPMDTQENEEDFDDDITPPPEDNIIRLHEPENQLPELPIEVSQIAPMPKIKATTESTETPNPSEAAAEIPEVNLISLDNLKNAKDIDECQGTKEIMSYIFNYLKKDFKKLMWVEISDNGKPFPRFVYGPWKMTTKSWSLSVELKHPNIFRIPWTSSLPFHGAISVNQWNQAYFELWNGGQNTDHATIYPIISNKKCRGFVVAFDKGEDFDLSRSLTKFDQLISVCEKSFQDLYLRKAA